MRQKFTQKERDNETGLDYFLARYYSSTQGRFTSPDEFSGGPDEYYEFHDLASENPTFYADLTDPQSLNKYQYAYNNPLLYIDPDGHQGVRERFRQAVNTAVEFTGGVMQGAVSSFTYGAVGAPSATDSRVNRAGQVVGTVLEGAGGLVLTGPGSGAIEVGSGGTATLVAVGTAAVGVHMIVGSGANMVRLATASAPMQRSSNGEENSGQKKPTEGEPQQGRTGGRNQPKDRSSEGTKENLKGLQKEQKRITKQGGYRIRTKKAEQNIDHANKQIKSTKDIKENQ